MSRNIDDIITPEFGALLRQAREARGLRLEDLAAKLRIQLHYLHAMETGNLSALPPNPYRKAFIKEYAKTLGVSLTPAAPPEPKPESTVTKASEMASTAARVTAEAVQSASKATESAMKKSVSQVKDAFDELTSRELWEEAEQVRRERLGLDTPQKPEPAGFSIKETPAAAERRSYTAPVAPPLPAETDEDDDYAEVFPSRMSRTSKIIVGLLVVATCIVLYFVFFGTTSENLQVVGQSPPIPVIPETHDTVLEEPAPTIPPTGDSMVLTLTAREQVWVSVTPDDRPGYRGMLEAGMSKTFVAANQYLLYLGNQHALDIMFDGRRLSQLPSIPNSKVVVRGLVLTRNKVYADTTAPTPKKTTTTVADTVKKNPPPPPVQKQNEPNVDQLPGPVRRRPVVKEGTPGVPKRDTNAKAGQ